MLNETKNNVFELLQRTEDLVGNISSMKSRTWAEIDLDNIVHNFNEFKRLSCNKKVMSVVKANAYGHGSITVTKALAEAGCDYFAVASLDEAIELRNAEITLPILVLNHIYPSRSFEILKYSLTQTIYNYDSARVISEEAIKAGKQVKVHIKIDTGMTRVGISWEDASNMIIDILRLPNIEVEGMFTHFASADEIDPRYTQMQVERFMNVVYKLKKEGIEIPIKHVCNSAASISYPDMHLDMIRPGVSLYGLYPSDEVDKNKINLLPAMSFKTQVLRINDIDEGVSLSYGRIFTTKRKSRIATLPVGYADGYTRMLTEKASVLINGQYAPVVGKICMDQCMIDITDIKGDVNIWDEVVLFGEQNGERILADDIGKLIGTINYEIVCMVARRIPRFYFKGGKLVSTENYLI
jgi:alanine racemase